MFTFLDPRVWLLALALAGVSGGLGYLKGRSDGHKLGSAEVQQRWDAIEAKRREVAAQAEQESRATERKRQEKANAAVSTATKLAHRARADADALRADNDGMRVQLDAFRRANSGRGTENTCAAADARTDAIGELLVACTTEYTEMARAAQGHLIDSLSARQAWPEDKQ